MKHFFAAFFGVLIFANTVLGAEPTNITVDEAAKLVARDTNVVVLDVRTPAEFKSGHIKGATNINFRDKEFADRISKLDKSKTYIIHCAAGGRSGDACKQIKDMKFEKMLHMNEGFNAWTKAGKPVEK
jgi:phage shock protein E